MLDKILRIFISAVGFLIGPGICFLTFKIIETISGKNPSDTLAQWLVLCIFVTCGIISGIIFVLLSKKLTEAIKRGIKSIESSIAKAPGQSLLSGAIGLILGLIIAALISVIISQLQIVWITVPLTIMVYIVLGAVGASVGIKRKMELTPTAKPAKKSSKSTEYISPKILDTSVIIDGRIFDICKTGMFEGDIIIPEFVLIELQKIADSADSLKRTKGRRGLDVIKKMQTELKSNIKIIDTDYEDVPDVDIKLLKLAKDIDGTVVTNDYNLNKVAMVQDVGVFNINELANALKPVLAAGEELFVTITKDGKEQNQGIAYLDDGTMIVVEGARNKRDQTIDVIVTSILQTAAGRMIFAKIKE